MTRAGYDNGRYVKSGLELFPQLTVFGLVQSRRASTESGTSAAREAIIAGTADPMVSNYSKRHRWQLLRINWLAPDIIAAIVEGRHPPSLTGRRLLRAADVPLSWEEQRRYFGFA